MAGRLRFRDRAEAGRKLADELASMISPPCVAAAIPRGGVAVALPIVERFHVPLSVVYARKLSAPFAPELAFGALDEDGHTIIDEAAVALLQLSPDDIEKAKERVRAEIQRRMELYRVPPLARYLPGSAVLLVDDGLATGLTMRMALTYARRHGATGITIATPCTSPKVGLRVAREADRFVGLIVDEQFLAVGDYYRDFSPVSDEEVLAMLASARQAAAPSAPLEAGLRVSFKNSLGLRLVGTLLVPASGGPHSVVVFAHGRDSGKDTPRNRSVARALVGAGIATFVFDFTGHGESEGTMEDSTQAQQVDDLRAALEVLETLDEVDKSRVGVIGSSSGAAVALTLASADPRVRALVLRSGNPEGAREAAPRVTVPTLLLVGEYDEAIRRKNEELLPKLGGPRRLEVVRERDHLFEDPAALSRAASLIVDWFQEHLR